MNEDDQKDIRCRVVENTIKITGKQSDFLKSHADDSQLDKKRKEKGERKVWMLFPLWW